MKIAYIPAKRILKAFVLICFGLLFLTQTSCKKFVAVNPPTTRIFGENVFTNDITASAVLTGLYGQLSADNFSSVSFSLPAISRFAALSADDLTLWSGAFNSGSLINTMQIAFYTNDLLAIPSGGFGGEFYGFFYSKIFTCNSVIEGVGKSNALTPAVKTQLLGEARFLRALFYFYLVNLYGELPLANTTDFEVNGHLSRSSVKQVYELIISDLKEAQTLLSTNYLKADLLTTTSERVRPTKWAAAALLARVYLYTKEWSKAEEQASLVINNSSLFSLVSLNNVFLKNSQEAIWQLQSVNLGWNTEDARQFIIPATGFTANNPVYLSEQLLNSFEADDLRKSDGNWIKKQGFGPDTFYYAYKYKSATQSAAVSEYVMLLRLAELYLVRSEALAEQNKVTEATDDLNKIRQRAGLAGTDANDQPSLREAIMIERQRELFTEMGHRWFDLKRTGNINSVMEVVAPQKINGIAWRSYQQLYPLPFRELQLNVNLVQNAGY